MTIANPWKVLKECVCPKDTPLIGHRYIMERDGKVRWAKIELSFEGATHWVFSDGSKQVLKPSDAFLDKDGIESIIQDWIDSENENTELRKSFHAASDKAVEFQKKLFEVSDECYALKEQIEELSEIVKDWETGNFGRVPKNVIRTIRKVLKLS